MADTTGTTPGESAPQRTAMTDRAATAGVDEADWCCDNRATQGDVHRPEQPEKRRSETRGDQQMPATLKLTHKAIGVEVRRGTYDVVVDSERVGSVEMNRTTEIPVEPGR